MITNNFNNRAIESQRNAVTSHWLEKSRFWSRVPNAIFSHLSNSANEHFSYDSFIGLPIMALIIECSSPSEFIAGVAALNEVI